MRLQLCLLLLALTASGCVTVQQMPTCTVAGLLDAGAVCSRFIGTQTNDLTFKELVDMLNAQPERVCVPVPGFNICAEDQSQGTPVTLPKRGAAIIIQASDFAEKKTEIETLCRESGKNCQYANPKR